MIFSENPEGTTFEYEYDENGHIIFYRNARRDPRRSQKFIEEHFIEYNDEYGDNPISEKIIVNGKLKVEDFYERDEKTSWIHKKSIREGREFNFWADCEYDEDGNLVRKLIYRGM